MTNVLNVGGRSLILQYVRIRKSPSLFYIIFMALTLGRDPWTEAEDNQLLDALDLHGKKWNLICGYLKGRPAVHCRNRWLSLLRSGRADNRDNNTLTRTSAIATLEAETCTIADTEVMVLSTPYLSNAFTTAIYRTVYFLSNQH